MWNIVANETREGEVFQKLFTKLEIEKQALGGKVFDILGEAFDNVSLKDLLMDAIRYGEDPAVRARMDQEIEGALDSDHLKEIMRRNALVESHMGMEGLYAIKEQMEKAEARRLQPFFIRAFFQEAFQMLGGRFARARTRPLRNQACSGGDPRARSQHRGKSHASPAALRAGLFRETTNPTDRQGVG
nr:hypothetical protein [Aeromonas veronii]